MSAERSEKAERVKADLLRQLTQRIPVPPEYRGAYVIPSAEGRTVWRGSKP